MFKFPKIKTPKISGRFRTEVSQENRRLTGVTPRLIKAYQESPARFLPRSKSLGLRGIASRGRKQGGIA